MSNTYRGNFMVGYILSKKNNRKLQTLLLDILYIKQSMKTLLNFKTFW